MEAGDAGADYVAFGAFHPTGTKSVEHYAESAILSWWTSVSPIPCVAIGGITADTARSLAVAGADFVAVSGAGWNSPLGETAAVEALCAAIAP